MKPGELQLGLFISFQMWNSKLSHLARSMFPGWLEPFAEARDLLIDQTFLSIAGLPSEIPESAEIQIALPFRFSGFGLRRARPICYMGFIAAGAATLPHRKALLGAIVIPFTSGLYMMLWRCSEDFFLRKMPSPCCQM